MNREAFSLQAAARDRGDAPALVTRDSTLGFGDLWGRVSPLLDELKTKSAGRPVCVVAALRLETLLAIYALAELGVPIALLHPRLTREERAALVGVVGAGLVLDESWSPSKVPPSDVSPPARAASEEAPLATLFTSGSSGTPKGVELSHRAFFASARASAANLGWTPTDRWLLCMPLGHVGGLSVVLRCLEARIPIVMSPWGRSVEPLLEDIDRCGATMLSLVPTMLARIFEEMPSYRFPAHVRAILLGGDGASASLLAAAKARAVPILTTYGMTEACSQIATLTPGEDPVGAGVGRPLPGTEVRFVDGEIQVRGPTLFTRYLPADRFPTPFLDGGWFPTGDLGRLDDAGHLHVTGRRSDLIITGGENIDPREVEAALEQCAGVRAACVFPVADERWGQLVAAAVVCDDPSAARAIALEVRSRLARHKWPRRIAACEELPLNGSGKLDRRQAAKSLTARLVAVDTSD
jgi:O-succinylbenzoic acid--CoA ligase